VNTRKNILSFPIFLLVFLIEESIFNQIHLPFGGFSLFLIFSLSWCALSTPETGAIAGFGAGLLMDLAPHSQGSVGQWTLVLIITGFGIAYLRYGDDSLRNSPLSLVVMVSLGVVVSLVLYVFAGALLGMDLGSSFQLMKTIIGNGVWTLAVTPFLLPIVSRLHGLIFETRELK
jgi:rod shape-determining protein MreD